MKFDNKMMLECNIAILTILCLLLLIFKLYLFGIITLIVDIAVVLYYVGKLRDNRNCVSKYRSDVKNILKTYDSILVEVSDIPDIASLNVIMVTNFKDMVDAQYEIRKPIYFKRYDNAVGFFILGEKEICVHIIKLNEQIKCPLEVKIENMRVCGYDRIEHFLDSFDTTGVISFGGEKSYRISPVYKGNVNTKDSKASVIYGSAKKDVGGNGLDNEEVLELRNTTKMMNEMSKPMPIVQSGIMNDNEVGKLDNGLFKEEHNVSKDGNEVRKVVDEEDLELPEMKNIGSKGLPSNRFS